MECNKVKELIEGNIKDLLDDREKDSDIEGYKDIVDWKVGVLKNILTFFEEIIPNKISRKDLLPEYYNQTPEPNFRGRGNHSVNELEKMLEQYREVVHLLRIQEQNILKITNSEIIE